MDLYGHIFNIRKSNKRFGTRSSNRFTGIVPTYIAVRTSGADPTFGTMEYKATVSLFRDCFRIGTFDYPFIDDNLKSLTGDADVSENWARLFDYVRFAKPVDAAKNQQTGCVIA